MKVAIIGGGVSGLGAAWLLEEYSDHDVTLFEQNDYVGGHTNTVKYKDEKNGDVDVDTGFIVFNELTYPNFVNFLNLKTVEYEKSDMSFSFSLDWGKFEYGTTNFTQIFDQLSNIWSPRFYLMLYDIFRFNLLAINILIDNNKDVTIGEYLKKEGYCDEFIQFYLKVHHINNN